MLFNLSCVLLCFQAVSGLNINLNKSKLMGFGERKEDGLCARVLGCKAVHLPIKYLGIPFGKYQKGIRWEPVIKMFERN